MSEGHRAWLSDDGSDPRLAWMMVLSALLHAAAAILLVALPRELFTRPPPPIVAYTVKIVDPNALGGRLPKGEIREEAPPTTANNPAPREEPKVEPKPEPKPPPPKPPEPDKPVEPKPEEKTVRLPDVKKKPEPKPPEKPREPSPKPKPVPEKKPSKEEVARIDRDHQIQEAIKRMGEKGKGKQASGLGGVEEGKGAALGTGGDGGGGGTLMGLDFIIYKNQVEAVIKKNWTWVGANPNLTIRVGFRIGEDGSIGELRILEKSGDGSYDESVMRAIRSSSPLPPPPEKYRQVFANYVLEFLSGELAKGG